jgi:hypothetical protein
VSLPKKTYGESHGERFCKELSAPEKTSTPEAVHPARWKAAMGRPDSFRAPQA